MRLDAAEVHSGNKNGNVQNEEEEEEEDTPRERQYSQD